MEPQLNPLLHNDYTLTRTLLHPVTSQIRLYLNHSWSIVRSCMEPLLNFLGLLESYLAPIWLCVAPVNSLVVACWRLLGFPSDPLALRSLKNTTNIPTSLSFRRKHQWGLHPTSTKPPVRLAMGPHWLPLWTFYQNLSRSVLTPFGSPAKCPLLDTFLISFGVCKAPLGQNLSCASLTTCIPQDKHKRCRWWNKTCCGGIARLLCFPRFWSPLVLSIEKCNPGFLSAI
jgi:hypothetical protein